MRAPRSSTLTSVSRLRKYSWVNLAHCFVTSPVAQTTSKKSATTRRCCKVRSAPRRVSRSTGGERTQQFSPTVAGRAAQACTRTGRLGEAVSGHVHEVPGPRGAGHNLEVVDGLRFACSLEMCVGAVRKRGVEAGQRRGAVLLQAAVLFGGELFRRREMCSGNVTLARGA